MKIYVVLGINYDYPASFRIIGAYTNNAVAFEAVKRGENGLDGKEYEAFEVELDDSSYNGEIQLSKRGFDYE
jgi:hypothetical protein